MSSQTRMSQDIHLPKRYDLFDRNAWLDGLLTKIETGKQRLGTPFPSRSPSPIVEDEVDDPFVGLGQAAAGPDGLYPSDIGTQDPPLGIDEDDFGDSHLVHGSISEGDVADGVLSSDVLEQALNNTGPYLPDPYYGNDIDELFDRNEYGQSINGDVSGTHGSSRAATEEKEASDEGDYDEDYSAEGGGSIHDDSEVEEEDEVIYIGDSDEEEEVPDQDDESDRGNEDATDDGGYDQTSALDDSDHREEQSVGNDGYDEEDDPDRGDEYDDELDRRLWSVNEAASSNTEESMFVDSAYHPNFSPPTNLGMPAPDNEYDQSIHDAEAAQLLFDTTAAALFNAQRSLYPEIPTTSGQMLDIVEPRAGILDSASQAQSIIEDEMLIDPELRDAAAMLSSTVYPALPLPNQHDTNAYADTAVTAAPFLDQEMSEPRLEAAPAVMETETSSSEGNTCKCDRPRFGPMLMAVVAEVYPNAPTPAQEDVIEILSSDDDSAMLYEDDENEEEHEEEEEEAEEVEGDERGSTSATSDASLHDGSDHPQSPKTLLAEDINIDQVDELDTADAADPSGSAVMEEREQSSPAGTLLPVTIEQAAPLTGHPDLPDINYHDALGVQKDLIDEQPTPDPIDARWSGNPALDAAAGYLSDPAPESMALNELIVEELPDISTHLGIEEIISRALAADVMEPPSTQNTPAVDAGVLSAEYFTTVDDIIIEEADAEASGRETEVVEEEMSSVLDGRQDTGASVRAVADIGVLDAVASAPSLETEESIQVSSFTDLPMKELDEPAPGVSEETTRSSSPTQQAEQPSRHLSRAMPTESTEISTRPAIRLPPRDSRMPVPMLLRTPAASPPPPSSIFFDTPDETLGLGDIVNDSSRETSPVEFPDPYVAPPDCQRPAALSPGEHLDTQLTRSPSMVVEHPVLPPEPKSVSEPTIRAESPITLPDPSLPPVDATLAAPFSPGEITQRPNPSPSLFVEAPEYPPVAASIVKEPHREDTPLSMPDPHSAPPDTDILAPLSPHGRFARESTPTPSIIVEPPSEVHTPFVPISAPGSRSHSPVLLPDPHAASPDTDRMAEDVPSMAERGDSLAPSVRADAGDEEVQDTAALGVAVSERLDDTLGQGEDEGTSIAGAAESADAMVVDAGHMETEENVIDDGKSDITEQDIAPEPARPQLSTTESMRLLHHHGNRSYAENAGTNQPIIAHHRTRSNARKSIAASPPVTRSHCFYRKLQLNGTDMSACVLVPQCTLFDFERLEEEESKDIGEATPEDEQAASGNAMTEEKPLLHPHLALKLHRIVGKTIFDEGHCFLLSSDERATQPAKEEEILTAHTPRPSRKRASVDHDEEVGESHGMELMSSSGTQKSAKRGSVARELASEDQSTPTRSPATRSRTMRRSTSRMSDDGPLIEPVSAFGSPAKRTRHQTRRSVSIATDAGEIEKEVREKTPVIVTVSSTPDGSIRRSARKSRRGQQSPVPEASEEEEEEQREITPTRVVVTQTLDLDPVGVPGGEQDPLVSGSLPDRRDAIETSHSSTSTPELSATEEGRRAGRASSAASAVESVRVDDTTNSGAASEAVAPEDEQEDDEAPTQLAAEGTVTRRKSRRLKNKAKEDEAMYRPAEAGSSTSADEDNEKDDDAPIEITPVALGTRKRKARMSSEALAKTEAADGLPDAADANEPAKETRGSKRRALASERSPEKPVLSVPGGAKTEEEDTKTQTSVKKGKGWFSFLRR